MHRKQTEWHWMTFHEDTGRIGDYFPDDTGYVWVLLARCRKTGWDLFARWIIGKSFKDFHYVSYHGDKSKFDPSSEDSIQRGLFGAVRKFNNLAEKKISLSIVEERVAKYVKSDLGTGQTYGYKTWEIY